MFESLRQNLMQQLDSGAKIQTLEKKCYTRVDFLYERPFLSSHALKIRKV